MCLLKLISLRMVASLLLVIIYTFGEYIELLQFHDQTLTGIATGAWQPHATPRILFVSM